MQNVTVIGTQWGDEGKGKIVDWLSERADIIVRFQGGHNAGHTLVIDGITYKLSLLPSGIVRKNKKSMIGNGVVICPTALLEEIQRVRDLGVSVTPDNLMISPRAHLILPIHQHLDKIREEARNKDNKIGTTGRGIGLAYEDKVARRGIHIGDLCDKDYLQKRLDALCEHHNIYLHHYGHDSIDSKKLGKNLIDIAGDIIPFIGNVDIELHQHHHHRKILFEGAQGVLLDIDHGTYPFVTSSNTVTGQVSSGTGVGPKLSGFALGIVKAYTTRVGAGPFPSELFDDTGELLGKRGHEFGTVTARKRRCGWFDALIVRHSCQCAGIDGLALTKLDILDAFDTIKICVGYYINGERYDDLPTSLNALENATPIYENIDGWKTETSGIRKWEELPNNAIKYIKRLEELLKTNIILVSTSPEREDTVLIEDPFHS